MSLQLGPFRLERLLARGGMGEVWLSRHISSDAKAAVKLLTGSRAEQPEFLSEFRREVQSTARLDHPNIVRVFDYGTLPEGSGELGLQVGAPYYVMELGEHGSVEDALPDLTWAKVREILYSLLTSLAHAHARGVIHRDIKPANILLRDADSGQVLLTDFGIAHAADRVTRTNATRLTSRSTEDATGTPSYMAPEQFMGKWRDYGPWTDMYSVGVLAYQMVCGQTPFTEATFVMYAMAHMNAPFPALDPRLPIPDGFDGWLERMVAKNPRERFQHAADAAWALSQLVDPADEAAFNSNGSNVFADETQDTIVDDAISGAWHVLGAAEHAVFERPPLPDSWRMVDGEDAFRPMPGAGLGLLGIRPTPFSGREPERDALWDALKRSQERTYAVVLRGGSGCGKTTLAQWLAHHAAECGAATVMYASHDRTPGARHGLGWLLASHYRSAGLPLEEALNRMRKAFHGQPHADLQARALTEIMRPQCTLTGEEATSLLEISSPNARHGFALKAIATEARRRPVIIWLDDCHHEVDSLTFIHYALGQPLGDLPILFIASVTNDDISDDAQFLTDQILEHDNAEILDLAPLDEDVVKVVLARMGLDAEVAQQVTARARGSVLFAVQMVQDWVGRGILRLDGARLVVDALDDDQAAPADVEEVWLGQLQDLATTFELNHTVRGADSRTRLEPDEIWQLLELAAALGREVDVLEWSESCERFGIEAAPEIFDSLAARNLGQLRDRQFTFINDRLRRILVESAKTHERWSKINRTLAQALTTRYGHDHPGLALRVAHHFVEAQDYGVASMCLDEAYVRAFRTGNQDKIDEVLDLQEQCLIGEKRPENHRDWGALLLKRSKLLVWRTEPEVRAEGIDLLRQSEDIARASGDRNLLAKVLNTRGWLANFSLNWDAGIADLEEAIQVAPDHVEAAIAHRLLGQLLFDGKHDTEGSRFHYRQSASLTRDPVDTFSAHQGLFHCAMADGDLESAQRHLIAAQLLAEEHGLMLGMAFVQENTALRAVADKRWDDADAAFARAIELQELLGPSSAQSTYDKIQRARVNVLAGNLSRAREIIRQIPATWIEEALDVTAVLALQDGVKPTPEMLTAIDNLSPRDPLLIAVVSTLPRV